VQEKLSSQHIIYEYAIHSCFKIEKFSLYANTLTAAAEFKIRGKVVINIFCPSILPSFDFIQ